MTQQQKPPYAVLEEALRLANERLAANVHESLRLNTLSDVLLQKCQSLIGAARREGFHPPKEKCKSPRYKKLDGKMRCTFEMPELVFDDPTVAEE